MPTLLTWNVPPTSNWSELEQITASALQIRWRTRDLTRNGRNGQAQHGVDIYREDPDGQYRVVQCKITERIELEVVKAEVRKAEKFKPMPSYFYLATTALHDAALQEKVRVFSAQRRKAGKFQVQILFWGDLMKDLASDPEEYYLHFPHLRPRDTEPKFNQLTFKELSLALAKEPISCPHYLPTGSVVLRELLRYEKALDDEVFPYADPSATDHFLYSHLLPALRRYGLVEAFARHPNASWLPPWFRLTKDGRAYLARLRALSHVLLEEEQQAANGEGREGGKAPAVRDTGSGGETATDAPQIPPPAMESAARRSA